MNQIEIDKLKTKVLKYILYKKRTEKQVRQKFEAENRDLLVQVIEELKEKEYLNDIQFIEKQVAEYLKLKLFSVKELYHKLLEKGLSKDLVEQYIQQNKEMLQEYEQQSIEKIKQKKSNTLDENQMKIYLLRKGFKVV